MTTAEQIVVSLEWAKKLQVAGFHQGWTGVGTLESFSGKPETMIPDIMGSYFKWFDVRRDYTKGEPCPQVGSVYCNYPMIAEAPTAEEILRRLPHVMFTTAGQPDQHISISKVGEYGWRIDYSSSLHSVLGDTLANAAAAMYCYLAEQNLLPTP